MRAWRREAGQARLGLGGMAVWLAVAALPFAGADATQPLPLREISTAADIQLPVQAAERRGSLVVLDQLNHRLIFLDSLGRPQRTLGRIGQRGGEFFNPTAFAFDRHSNIYVKDSSNRRIEVFDWNGKFLAEFPDTPKSIGMAVNSRGEILLGQPHLGKLVTVYDRSGNRLRSFGELKKLSDFYGSTVVSEDPKFKFAINRIRICVDASDNVHLAFQGAPFFQKYDDAGRLVFERGLAGPEGQGIAEAYLRAKGRAPGRSTIDNVAIPWIVSGITVHGPTGNIFIAFQWRSSWIYVADPKGRHLATLEPERPTLFSRLSFSEDATALVTTRVSMKSKTVYRLPVPTWLLGHAP